MSSKKYLNISEVAKMLDLKEHVIRYWDSIDPKTQKLRVEGISTKTKGGTRFFNRENIIKLERMKNLLYEDGHQNYSLVLANRLVNYNKKHIKTDSKSIGSKQIKNSENIQQILNKMRLLLKKNNF